MLWYQSYDANLLHTPIITTAIVVGSWLPNVALLLIFIPYLDRPGRLWNSLNKFRTDYKLYAHNVFNDQYGLCEAQYVQAITCALPLTTAGHCEHGPQMHHGGQRCIQGIHCKSYLYMYVVL